MTTEQARETITSAIKVGSIQILPTPQKRSWSSRKGLTEEQKHQRHKAQMRQAARNRKAQMSMSLDTANRVINEQEEQISELENKILDREDQRDKQLDRVMELQKAMRRIECSIDLETAHRIAVESLKL